MADLKPLIIVVSWSSQRNEPDFELSFKAHNGGRKLIILGSLPSRDIITGKHNVEKVIVIQPKKRKTYDDFKNTAAENLIPVIEVQSKNQVIQHI